MKRFPIPSLGVASLALLVLVTKAQCQVAADNQATAGRAAAPAGVETSILVPPATVTHQAENVFFTRLQHGF
ncbi:MAG: hypothetical protein MUF81_17285 [Verrucomicrobia bacterium]|nr:hypothetical protein [Verrucomicrobiota bacterium]